MTKLLKFSYLVLCLGFVIFMMSSNFFRQTPLLSKAGDVLMRVEGGPDDIEVKRTVRVKTSYMWNDRAQCNCPQLQLPCIKTFVNKDIPQPSESFSPRMNNYYMQGYTQQYPQGAEQVPYAIETGSVNILYVPFCKQSKEADKTREKSSQETVIAGQKSELKNSKK